jgi:hypothetical protein
VCDQPLKLAQVEDVEQVADSFTGTDQLTRDYPPVDPLVHVRHEDDSVTGLVGSIADIKRLNDPDKFRDRWVELDWRAVGPENLVPSAEPSDGATELADRAEDVFLD